MKVLQTSALPLGYVAAVGLLTRVQGTTEANHQTIRLRGTDANASCASLYIPLECWRRPVSGRISTDEGGRSMGTSVNRLGFVRRGSGVAILVVGLAMVGFAAISGGTHGIASIRLTAVKEPGYT